MRVLGLLFRCIMPALLIGDCFWKASSSQVFVYGGTQSGRIPVTEDYPSFSVVDCSRRCTEKSCQAFFYEMGTKLCRLVIHLFTVDTGISMAYQDTGGLLDLYIKPGTQSLLTSTFDCPSVSGEETTVVTPWLELTFRVYNETMNHTEAWQACRVKGMVLMKIATVEKQAVVRHVLNTCPVLSPNQYWLDGYQNSTTDVWQFADGSLVPMDQTHFWHESKPDHKYQCLRTRTGHKWDDNPCGNLKAYICEA